MEIIKLIRVLTIIALLILGFAAWHYKFGDCDKCKFKIDNKQITASQFMDKYIDKCFSKNEPIRILIPEIPHINFS